MVPGAASAGFVVQMGIAVGAGGLLTLLPIHVKDIIVAVLFLGGAGYLLLSHDETAEEKGTRDAAREQEASRGREIATAFPRMKVSCYVANVDGAQVVFSPVKT